MKRKIKLHTISIHLALARLIQENPNIIVGGEDETPPLDSLQNTIHELQINQPPEFPVELHLPKERQSWNTRKKKGNSGPNMGNTPRRGRSKKARHGRKRGKK